MALFAKWCLLNFFGLDEFARAVAVCYGAYNLEGVAYGAET